jgi:signal transduction histidine kinase
MAHAISSSPFYYELQPVLKALSILSPKACLDGIARELQVRLDCEAAGILLWDEETQLLSTEHRHGIPEKLRNPEKYALDQGITGKYVFSCERRIRGIVDFDNETVYDDESQETIRDKSIKWENMRKFRERSSFNDFKSLLAVPLYVRKQKLGVVKLINKKASHGSGLSNDGFSKDDLGKVDYFLETIQHVVEAKINESQVKALLELNETNARAVFNFEEALKEISSRCARALNFRICLIRLMEAGRLYMAAYHSALDIEDAFDPMSISAFATATNRSITWREAPDSPDGLYSEMDCYSCRRPEIIRRYNLRSLVIVPITKHERPVGTIECYTTLSREFSEQEVNTIKTYTGPVVMALMNRTQKRLLEGLIEIQTIGVGAGAEADRSQERHLIPDVLERIRDSLGPATTLLGVAFSKSRLSRTKLSCEHLYGVNGPEELEHSLTRDKYEALCLILDEGKDAGSSFWDVPANCAVGPDGKPLTIYKAPISLMSRGMSVGVVAFGTSDPHGVDGYSRQIIDFGAKSLGVALENIEGFRKLEYMPEIINEVSRTRTLQGIYELILKHTIHYFGFDYGAISRVDYDSLRVRTEMAESRNRSLVDPQAWRSLSQYGLSDTDILCWVISNKKPVVIVGPEVARNWDERLNREIFYKYHHEQLIRVFVPFIHRRNIEESPGRETAEKELVVGVIEAGYHISTQRKISKHEQELFTLFISHCAENLQRVILIEERKAIDHILGRIGSQADELALLESLVEESVRFLGASSGMIMFLNYSDERLLLTDHPVTYGLSAEQRGRLIDHLEIRGRGKRTGIVAHVAAKREPYWSNDVDNDPKYLKEYDEVRSELAVPLLYAGQLIGVLDVYSFKKDSFDRRKATLLETIAGQAASLYQKVRVSNALSGLVDPFNIFSGIDAIYSTIVRTIEQFLAIETVSLWEISPTLSGFRLDLADASQPLKQAYSQDNITQLGQGSFSGQAAKNRETLQVSWRAIRGCKFEHSEFALRNDLKAMTAVPIATEHETYAVIDVFSRRDTRLFPDEIKILEALASKAASTVFGAKLIHALNLISEALVEGNIETILEAITSSAVDLLHADPVILVRYDAEQRKLLAEPTVAGHLFHPGIKKSVRSIKAYGLAQQVLEGGSNVYLDNEDAYLGIRERFDGAGRRQAGPGFWVREGICSSAALRLVHAGEIVGIMFVNYRSSRPFNESTKKLIEGFAALAASAIVNGRLAEQNRSFVRLQRRESLALSGSEIVAGLAHNSGNLLDSIALDCLTFENKLQRTRGKTINKLFCERFLNDLREPLNELIGDFDRLREYRQFGGFKEESCKIEDLIDRCLLMLRKRLENRCVEVTKLYGNTPEITCDKKQIQHMLLNLLINSSDALAQNGRRHSGKISVQTATTRGGNYVQVNIRDNGAGIPRMIRGRVFEPFFTTKENQGGAGLGLPVSRYIVETHGGTIKIETPRKKRGTVLKVLLPIRRRERDDNAQDPSSRG